jgi:hypothetical protein
MGNRLLDRQASLLAYLTSGGAIFGDGREAELPVDLRGIDPALLRLEARFSYEKRLEKISSIFPRTLGILGVGANAVLRHFAEHCPPAEMTRLANARQFRDYASAQCRGIPYLADVIACEFALAAATGAELDDLPTQPGLRGIRRHPAVLLLRCRYDVQPIFDQTERHDVPVERDTPLAITCPPGASGPRIVSLPSAVFDLLSMLNDWTEPSAFDLPTAQDLVRELADHALIEVFA